MKYLVKYHIVWLFTKIGRIKPVYEVVGCCTVVCRHKIASFRSQHALTASSLPQSMIARLVLNLLKSRDTTAVLQRSTAFDAFPL